MFTVALKDALLKMIKQDKSVKSQRASCKEKKTHLWPFVLAMDMWLYFIFTDYF